MKICEKCGAQLDDNAAFCGVCGASSDPKPVLPDQPFQFSQPQFYQPQQLNQPPQFDQQPQFYQTPKFDQAPQLNNPTQFSQPQQFAQPAFQGGAVAANTNSKKKLIIIISAIVALVAVVLILFLFVFKSNKDKLIGTWKADGANGYIKFEKDGRMDLGTGKQGTYTVDGDEISVSDGTLTYIFEIKKLTGDTMTLTFKGKDQSFTKVDDGAIDDYMNVYIKKASLKTANSNAKLIYVTLNNTAADLMADGEQSKLNRLDFEGPVDSLPDDALGKAVKDAMKDYGEDTGYVYIHFDPNADYNANTNIVRWSKSESGDIVGQYPDPPKTVEDAQDISLSS